MTLSRAQTTKVSISRIMVTQWLIEMEKDSVSPMIRLIKNPGTNREDIRRMEVVKLEAVMVLPT